MKIYVNLFLYTEYYIYNYVYCGVIFSLKKHFFFLRRVDNSNHIWSANDFSPISRVIWICQLMSEPASHSNRKSWCSTERFARKSFHQYFFCSSLHYVNTHITFIYNKICHVILYWILEAVNYVWSLSFKSDHLHFIRVIKKNINTEFISKNVDLYNIQLFFFSERIYEIWNSKTWASVMFAISFKIRE